MNKNSGLVKKTGRANLAVLLLLASAALWLTPVPATASPFEGLQMPEWIEDWHLVIPSKGEIDDCPVRTYTYVNNLKTDNKKYATFWILYAKSRKEFYLRSDVHSDWKPDFFHVSRKKFKNQVKLANIPGEAKTFLLGL
jgi:hypothetical protein